MEVSLSFSIHISFCNTCLKTARESLTVWKTSPIFNFASSEARVRVVSLIIHLTGIIESEMTSRRGPTKDRNDMPWSTEKDFFVL